MLSFSDFLSILAGKMGYCFHGIWYDNIYDMMERDVSEKIIESDGGYCVSNGVDVARECHDAINVYYGIYR